jgi:hypothetical protein
MVTLIWSMPPHARCANGFLGCEELVLTTERRLNCRAKGRPFIGGEIGRHEICRFDSNYPFPILPKAVDERGSSLQRSSICAPWVLKGIVTPQRPSS